MVVPGQFDDAPEDPKTNTTASSAAKGTVSAPAPAAAAKDDAHPLRMLSIIAADSKSKEKHEPAVPVPATSEESNGETTQTNLVSNPNKNQQGDRKIETNASNATATSGAPNGAGNEANATTSTTAEGTNMNEAGGANANSTDEFLRNAVADIYGGQTNVATAGTLLNSGNTPGSAVKGKVPPPTAATNAANGNTNTSTNTNISVNNSAANGAPSTNPNAAAQAQAQAGAGAANPSVATAPPPPYGSPYHNPHMNPHHANVNPRMGMYPPGHYPGHYPPAVYGAPSSGYPNDVNGQPPPYGYHPHHMNPHAVNAHQLGAMNVHPHVNAHQIGMPMAHHANPQQNVYGAPPQFAPGYGGGHAGNANLAHAPGYPAYPAEAPRSKRLPAIPPNNIYLINTSNINENDVLCGRGGLTNQHVGNKKFRALVKQLQDKYMTRKKHEKTLLSQAVVAVVRGSTPAGRFLKQDTQTGMWYDIGDEMATEKTSQAFREKSKAKLKKADSGEIKSKPLEAAVAAVTATVVDASKVNEHVREEVAAAAAMVTKEANATATSSSTEASIVDDKKNKDAPADAPSVGEKRSADEAEVSTGKQDDEANPTKRVAAVVTV